MTVTTATPYRVRSAEVIARYGKLATTNYATADAKGKAAIRKAVADHFALAMRNGDLVSAPLWFGIQEGLKSAKATKAATEVNVAQVLAERIMALRIAADLLEGGAVLPDGISADDAGSMAEGALETALASVGFASVADTANKLASAKVTRSTARNSIEDVFARAFDGQDKGTVLTVTDIRNMGRTDDYTPSPGAIAARYRDGVCTVEGYEAVPATVNAPLSFRSI